MESKFLTPRQVNGLCKVGDTLAPGNVEFPLFSASRCAEQVDRVMAYMPVSDQKDLAMLLGILGLFPRFLVGWVLMLIRLFTHLPGSLGALPRMIQLGLRGLVFSLYYGDPQIHEVLGYSVDVYRGDLVAIPQKVAPVPGPEQRE